MKIISFGKTDIGLRRKNNEDAYLAMPEHVFCTVVDGMGGSADGEVASGIFVEAAKEVFKCEFGRSVGETSALVREAFRLGNERILAHAGRYPQSRGMGCTAELIAFTENMYIVGHVGDSRTYQFRDGELRQITKDHSLVQNQLEQGLITQEEAKKHHLRNIVLRAVGIQPSIELDMIRGKTLPGDIYLLCSDGLTDMIDDALIQDILSSPMGLADKVEQLIEQARSAGGHDNITVVLCRAVPA